ncbi:LytR C-terminal domain-containing protein [Brachybacterium sp. AOP3-A1-3]|uniref:LytR C-terminal domain-containing protein n=1 Tax=Brachybacterium sp. AOP3-A1-3 TaxID=3457699 RepID=UPI0040333415
MSTSHRDAHPYGRSADDVRRREQRVRRTRRLRATQLGIFSLLALLLIGVGTYAVGQFREPVQEPGVIGPTSATEESTGLTCPEPGAVPLPPKSVTVTVLNGTGRGGLAGDITEQLAERGFAVGDPGNTKKASGAATVVYGPKGYLAAESVRAQVPDATLTLDEREDETVDLLLGNGFSTLAEQKDATAALEKPVEIPEGCPTG